MSQLTCELISNVLTPPSQARTPFVESDPRVELEPNFYYPQEDVLYEYTKRNNIGWNIICPAWIIGV